METEISPKYAVKENEKYGKLKIIKKYVIGRRTKTECLCDCGNICTRNYDGLRNGSTKSCGCDIGLKHKTHGLYKHKLYIKFGDMKSRCYNKKHKKYYNYGGRGIIICDEWLNDFTKFYNWSIENGYIENKNLSIDRINNNGNYEPSNCRWATLSEQANNKRVNRLLTAFGEIKNISQWAKDERCNVPHQTLMARINMGIEAEKAISTPPRKKK